MECPQDHFTSDALGGQGAGKDDRVVDGDIYYGDMFFLTWASKHEKEDLHAAHSSFLFMDAYQTTMEDSFMDPCVILLPAYGKNFFFPIIDWLTQ